MYSLGSIMTVVSQKKKSFYSFFHSVLCKNKTSGGGHLKISNPYKTNLPIKGSSNDHSNCIGGVMVSVLASSAVDGGFEPRSGQTKDYKIGICCFSAKYAALRRKSGATCLPADCCFSELAL